VADSGGERWHCAKCTPKCFGCGWPYTGGGYIDIGIFGVGSGVGVVIIGWLVSTRCRSRSGLGVSVVISGRRNSRGSELGLCALRAIHRIVASDFASPSPRLLLAIVPG